MAIQSVPLNVIDPSGAQFILHYDDVSMKIDSLEITGTTNRKPWFKLLDPANSQILWDRVYQPGDGSLKFPGVVSNDPRTNVEFQIQTRPFDGAQIAVLVKPFYIIEFVGGSQIASASSQQTLA